MECDINKMDWKRWPKTSLSFKASCADREKWGRVPSCMKMTLLPNVKWRIFQIINLGEDIDLQQMLKIVSGYVGLCEEERPNYAMVQPVTTNTHFWRWTYWWDGKASHNKHSLLERTYWWVCCCDHQMRQLWRMIWNGDSSLKRIRFKKLSSSPPP